MRTLLLFLSCFVLSGIQAQNSVTGYILDVDGNPIFAANIYWSGNPQAGCSSSLDGAFSLKVGMSKDTLCISSLSYATRRIPLTSIDVSKPLNVILHFSASKLESFTVSIRDPISEEFSVEKITQMDVYLNPMSQGDP